jgi:hypothetical protein
VLQGVEQLAEMAVLPLDFRQRPHVAKGALGRLKETMRGEAKLTLERLCDGAGRDRAIGFIGSAKFRHDLSPAVIVGAA